MNLKEKADVLLVLPASNLTHPFEVKHTQEFFFKSNCGRHVNFKPNPSVY